MRMMLIKVVLLLAVCLFAVAAYGQQTSSGSLPSPALYFKFGLSGIAGDQQYLYVMTGGKIMQYRNENGALTLLASFDLPQPPVPSGAQPPPRATGSGQLPPPPPPLPHGLWAGNGSLYVLAGPFVYIYSVSESGLSLQNTIELPKPDFPQAGT